MILMDVELDDERIPALRAQGTQAALIGLPDDPPGLSCVDHDFAAAGALCADHLADLGHREIAFIGYGAASTSATPATRSAPWTASATAPSARACASCTARARAPTTARRARSPASSPIVPDTTGFVVQNEGAIGPLLNLLRASGRTVPEDASVIALCPEQLAEQHAPRLTAVTGPAQELGRVAVEQVMARISAAARGEAPEDELVLLTPVLTVRESTGPAPQTSAGQS